MGRIGRRVAVAALVVLAVAAILAAGQRAGAAVPRFADWVSGLGAWGPAAFVAGYVVATVAFVPGSLLSLGAGALFGLARGSLLVLVGATLGASAAFLVARYVARGTVERRLAGDPRLAAIDRAVEQQGRRIVFLLRLSPAFPFTLLNYALGLTRVRYVDFLIASVGMLPGILLYVYYGKVLGDVTRLAGGARVARGGEYWTLLAVGLAATILAAALVARIARRALADVTGGPREQG